MTIFFFKLIHAYTCIYCFALKKLGFFGTDCCLGHVIKTTSVLLFCKTPIFFCMNYFVAHERNAWWWNLMLLDVVCCSGECRCSHTPQELELWIVGNVMLLNKNCIICYCRFFLYIPKDVQNAHAAFHKLNRKALLNFLAFICDNKKLLSIYT